jgi:hypothetical protein
MDGKPALAPAMPMRCSHYADCPSKWLLLTDVGGMLLQRRLQPNGQFMRPCLSLLVLPQNE